MSQFPFFQHLNAQQCDVWRFIYVSTPPSAVCIEARKYLFKTRTQFYFFLVFLMLLQLNTRTKKEEKSSETFCVQYHFTLQFKVTWQKRLFLF